MSTLTEYISLKIICDKFKESQLLPVLKKIFQSTNGLTKKSSVLLSSREKERLLAACDNNHFDPAWVLMTSFGILLPDHSPPTRATDRFKFACKMEIKVIIHTKIALINIVPT